MFWEVGKPVFIRSSNQETVFPGNVLVGGQTRRQCFLAMFWEVGKPVFIRSSNQETVFPGNVLVGGQTGGSVS